MILRILVITMVSLAVSGCSFYDVAALTADSLLEIASGPDEKGEPKDDDDFHRVWNAETSDCIQEEKGRQAITKQLNAIESKAIKEGKDYVVLPTGEKYPIDRYEWRGGPLIGPTGTCLIRTSK